jgi:hypothetical protein
MDCYWRHEADILVTSSRPCRRRRDGPGFRDPRARAAAIAQCDNQKNLIRARSAANRDSQRIDLVE